MELSIGQEVAVVWYNGYGAQCSFGFKVTKVTPSGQVVVKNATGTEYRFDKKGREIGASSHYMRHELRTDVEYLRSEKERKQRQQVAANAINNVKLAEPVRSSWGKDSMLEEVAKLEALLATARAAVEAI